MNSSRQPNNSPNSFSKSVIKMIIAAGFVLAASLVFAQNIPAPGLVIGSANTATADPPVPAWYHPVRSNAFQQRCFCRFQSQAVYLHATCRLPRPLGEGGVECCFFHSSRTAV